MESAAIPPPQSTDTHFAPDVRFIVVAGVVVALAWAAGLFDFHHHYTGLRYWELGPLGPTTLPALARLAFAPLFALAGLDRLTWTPGWRVAIVVYALAFAWCVAWAEWRLLASVRPPRGAWLARVAVPAIAAVTSMLLVRAPVSAVFFGVVVIEAYALIAIAMLVAVWKGCVAFVRRRFADPAGSVDRTGAASEATLQARRLVTLLLIVAVCGSVLLFVRGIPRVSADPPRVHALGHDYWTYDGERVRAADDPSPPRPIHELYDARMFLGEAEWVSIAPSARFVAWQTPPPRLAVLVFDDFGEIVDTLAAGVHARRHDLRWQELRNRVVLLPAADRPRFILRLAAALDTLRPARGTP